MQIKKYPKFDLENRRLSFLLVGIIVAASAFLIVFEWQSINRYEFYKQRIASKDLWLDDEVLESVDIERPVEELPKVSPTTLPLAKITNTQVSLEIKKVDNIDPELGLLPDLENGMIGSLPPLEKPVELPTDVCFNCISEIPTFKQCVNIVNDDKRKQCTYQVIRDHISERIVYPSDLKEMGFQGKIYVQFLISEEGEVIDVKGMTKNEVHPGLIEEAERVLGTLPNFIPGRQGHRKVRVKFTQPVVFSVN